MQRCLAIFRSRTHTVGFIQYMRSQGVEISAVNTPAEAKIGCGISAIFPVEHIAFARQVVSALGLTSFRGFFLVKKEGIKQIITKL